MGAAELFAPVTTAVKVSVPPKVGTPDEAIVIAGIARSTKVEFEEVTASTGSYAPPPVKVNVAE